MTSERALSWAASVEHEVLRLGVRTTDWRRFNLTAFFPDKSLLRRSALGNNSVGVPTTSAIRFRDSAASVRGIR